VEPGDVTRRNLQIEDAHRSTLKHLPVMRLLVDGHDWRLAVPTRIGRLPRRALTGNRHREDHETTDNARERGRRANHGAMLTRAFKEE
jgi:hypothetical protein